MASIGSKDGLLTVLDTISADGAEGRAAEAEMRGWSRYEWQSLLLELPVSGYTFQSRFERTWDSVIKELHEWCREFRTRPDPSAEQSEIFGHLGLLLITLVSLRHSEEYRHLGRTAKPGEARPPMNHDCETLCVGLVAEPAVRAAIRSIYDPGLWIPGQDPDGSGRDSGAARNNWSSIDFDSLRFHRHGTTSFILAGAPGEEVQGRRPDFALKCLVYPFLQAPTIVRATRGYRAHYGRRGGDPQHLVRIWASSSSWVLMDLVPGQTLADYLDELRRTGRLAEGPRTGRRRRDGGQAQEIDLDLLTTLGRALFAAMAELERAGLRHSDLSPSNIMVRPEHDGAPLSFVLIDFGVNYLYQQAMPGLEGPDGRYVAPELRAGGSGTDRTDLYSLGQLLITVAGAQITPDGSVPDLFYAETPVLARFIEDLIDAEPERRLLIFQPDTDRPLYPQLQVFFDEERQAMAAARAAHGRLAGPAWLANLVGMFTPLAGAPSRQLRMWQIRRSQGLYRDPRRGMHVRRLLFTSWLSAAAWYVAITIVVMWWLRDLGWDWGNQAIAFLQQITDSPEDRFPYLDGLRAADYPIPDLAGNLPVRMVGMSFLMAGARYYQNIFAGLTPMITGWRQGGLSLLAVLTEAQMRAFALVAFVLVLPPTLVQRDWWPICTAIGILLIFLCNWTCYSFAQSALARARERGLSTVPPGRHPTLESFADWTPSAAFYMGATWIIGTLIYLNLVKDVYVYAGAVTAINIVLFYVIKCSGRSAADVRTALGRAFLAAERLRYAALPGTNPVGPAAAGRSTDHRTTTRESLVGG